MSNLAPPPHLAYRRASVLAATPGELVVMLYDGAMRFLHRGAVAMAEGQVEVAHNALRRGERIIRHLDATLDFDQGELPQRLHAIYAFCLAHLSAARYAQDVGKIEEVGELLGELRDAWSQVAAEGEQD